MKKLMKKFSWWLVLPFFTILFLIGCQTREKNVKKTETQSEKKSEATYKIEDKTFEIVLEKELSNSVKTNFIENSETSKTETKNVEIIKEYYENGTLKKEFQRNFSELAETTKKAISELEQKISTEKENSKYWENSSNHYYQLLEQEKAKSKSKEMQLKAKPSFTWQWFFSGLLIGWIVLSLFWRWFKAWLLRFNPYLKLVEKVKKVFGKL